MLLLIYNWVQEEELEKQRLAEVFEDFRETFESTKATKVAFVRGEVVNAGTRTLLSICLSYSDCFR